jgi:pre-rRNA-processing protein TSR4
VFILKNRKHAIQTFFFAPPGQAPSCDSCKTSLPLLAQIYAPLSDEQVDGREEYDRVLYVWGCAQKACTKRTIKAVRALKKNKDWAEDLTRRRRDKEKARLVEEESKTMSASNPFVVRPFCLFDGMIMVLTVGQANPSRPTINPFSQPSASNPFSSSEGGGGGIGLFIFGGGDTPVPPPAPTPQPELKSVDDDQDAPLAAALSRSVSLSPPTPHASWSTSTAFPAQYISTFYETLSSTPLSASSKNALRAAAALSNSEGSSTGSSSSRKASQAEDREEGGGGDSSWSGEGYEVQKIPHLSSTFLAFASRIQSGGSSQCIRFVLSLSLSLPSLPLSVLTRLNPTDRYERAGQPLMSRSDDDVYSLLFPTRAEAAPPGSQSTVTRAVHARASVAPPLNNQRHYTPQRVAPCDSCGVPRAFEFQLMPNLVGELERAGAGEEHGEVEFGWTTALVFVCSEDCLVKGKDEVWREEVVLVQLDD